MMCVSNARFSMPRRYWDHRARVYLLNDLRPAKIAKFSRSRFSRSWIASRHVGRYSLPLHFFLQFYDYLFYFFPKTTIITNSFILWTLYARKEARHGEESDNLFRDQRSSPLTSIILGRKAWAFSATRYCTEDRRTCTQRYATKTVRRELFIF